MTTRHAVISGGYNNPTIWPYLFTHDEQDPYKRKELFNDAHDAASALADSNDDGFDDKAFIAALAEAGIEADDGEWDVSWHFETAELKMRRDWTPC